MKKLLLSFLLIFSLSSFSSEKEDQVQVEKLIKSILSSEDLKGSSFEASECKIQKEKWLALLLGGPSFKEEIKFTKKCDLEGTFSPKVGSNFPIDLKIRNFKTFNKLNGQTLITLTLEMEPKLSIKLSSASLIGEKKKVLFDINYAATVNPLNSKIIEKDLGGMLLIREIDGKKVNKKYPLKGYLKN